MSAPERWPRPLRAAFRTAMREKPPEVIRNPELLKALERGLVDVQNGRVTDFANMDEAVAALNAYAALREQRRADPA